MVMANATAVATVVLLMLWGSMTANIKLWLCATATATDMATAIYLICINICLSV